MKGFSLVELLVVIAVIPLITALSIPTYAVFKKKESIATNIDAAMEDLMGEAFSPPGDNLLCQVNQELGDMPATCGKVNAKEVGPPYTYDFYKAVPLHLVAAVFQEALGRLEAGVDDNPIEVSSVLGNAVNDIEKWWLLSGFDWSDPGFFVYQACKVMDTKRVLDCLSAGLEESDEGCVVTDFCVLLTNLGHLGSNEPRYVLEMVGQTFSDLNDNTGSINVLLHHRLLSDTWRFSIRCYETAQVACAFGSSIYCQPNGMRHCGTTTTPDFIHWKIDG